MQLGSVTVYSDALRTEQHPKSMSFDTDRERGTLSLPTSLPAGSKAQVSISFEGPLTGALMGYYRSVGGADGKEVYSLTQFEVCHCKEYINIHKYNGHALAHGGAEGIPLLGRASIEGNVRCDNDISRRHGQPEQYVR